jgi:hypothetical protein
LVDILEKILFKGCTHSKRGSGFTSIPEKVLKNDICKGVDIKKEIRDIFILHFREKFLEENEKEKEKEKENENEKESDQEKKV